MMWIFEKLGCPRRSKRKEEEESPVSPLPLLPATPPESIAESNPETPNHTPYDAPHTPETNVAIPISTVNEQAENIEKAIEEATLLKYKLDYISAILKPHFNSTNRKIRIPYKDGLNIYNTDNTLSSVTIDDFNKLVTTCISLNEHPNWTSTVTKKIIKIKNNDYKHTIKSRFAKNSVTINMPKSLEEYQKLLTLEAEQ